MTILIKLMYVGAKPTAFDNVARSGKVWHGNGDIQEVTDAQARLLTKYPDQWALVNPDDQEFLDQPTYIQARGEDGTLQKVDEADLGKPLERMTKLELGAMAKLKWGKDLDPSLTKKAMTDQIEEWQRELSGMTP